MLFQSKPHKMLFAAAAILVILPTVLGATVAGTLPVRYIVKVKDSTAANVVLNSMLSKYRPDRVFRGPAFKGFAGTFDAASLGEVRGLPEVRDLSRTTSERGWKMHSNAL